MNGYYERGKHRVHGVLAEIFSVLERSAIAFADDPGLWDLALQATDVRVPSEERIEPALAVIAGLRRRARFASWIPWYDRLQQHEFANEFYPGYRDHTVHTLQVYLFGVYLYETSARLRTALDASLATCKIATESAATVFLEWWSLAALYHDVGYPFEVVDYILEPDRRRSVLNSLAGSLSAAVFEPALDRLGIALSPSQRRDFCRAGRYYPLALESTTEVMRNERAARIVTEFWHRHERALACNNVLDALDRISTSAPAGRPPFHDHGLAGAALLGALADDTLTFLEQLADAASRRENVVPIAVQESPIIEECLSMIDAQPLIDRAIEAIAYHNINLDNFDATELNSVGVIEKGQERPLAGIEQDACVFFLALVDTLQDWDRHHFAVQGVDGKRYRPAVQSADVLFQGTKSGIGVSFSGDRGQDRGQAADDVRRVLAGWLNSEDLSSLISEGAGFTYPEAIGSLDGPTLAQESHSRRVAEQLIDQFRAALHDARTELIQNGADAIAKVATLATTRVHETERRMNELTLSDSQRVRDFIDAGDLLSLQRMAATLVREGTKLPYGTVLRSVGKGGFGRVWEVSRPESITRALLCFKLFNGDDLAESEKRRLFERGFAAMQRLDAHPNIVSVKGFSELPVGFYMELIPGPNLEESDFRDWPMADRISFSSKVAEATAYAHSQGVIHRDLKPANVLVDPRVNNDPVVTDFDLAWIDGRTQQTQARYATIRYGAPEQFETRILKTTTLPTVDVYGFGALLYFILTGSEPPVGASWTEEHWHVLGMRLEGKVPAAAATKLRELVERSTKKRPDDRFQSFEPLVAELARVLVLVTRPDSKVRTVDWDAEVRFRANGRVAEPGRAFNSRAGGLTWVSTDTSSAGTPSNPLYSFKASGLLNRDPCYEGVNYQGFVKGSIKQVDSRLREFENEWPGSEARRHGRISASGSTFTVSVVRLPPTLGAAAAVGQLLASIARIVE